MAVDAPASSIPFPISSWSRGKQTRLVGGLGERKAALAEFLISFHSHPAGHIASITGETEAPEGTGQDVAEWLDSVW